MYRVESELLSVSVRTQGLCDFAQVIFDGGIQNSLGDLEMCKLFGYGRMLLLCGH